MVSFDQNTLELAIKIWAFKSRYPAQAAAAAAAAAAAEAAPSPRPEMPEYAYYVPKPNNEEITYSTIGYKRLNTIIL